MTKKEIAAAIIATGKSQSTAAQLVKNNNVEKLEKMYLEFKAQDISPDQDKTNGRPPGSKTQNHPQILEIKSACKTCGKTTLKQKKTHKPQAINIEINGQRYNSQTRRLMVCTSCGQHAIKKTLELI